MQRENDATSARADKSEIPKVWLVADEVIVAKLPERNLSKDKLSEGLHLICF
jgi:hypothetical protein